MLGLINNAFCDYVRKHSGEEAWRRIEDRLETRFFIGIEDYDDQTTLALAAAAAAEVGLPQDGVFEAVGEHFARTTVARDFGILLNAGGKTFPEFLRELPEIQTRVELIYPSLKAPTFSVDDDRDGGLTLLHHTARKGLAPLLAGILRGLAEVFGTRADVSWSTEGDGAAPHHAFRVHWGAQARRKDRKGDRPGPRRQARRIAA